MATDPSPSGVGGWYALLPPPKDAVNGVLGTGVLLVLVVVLDADAANTHSMSAGIDCSGICLICDEFGIWRVYSIVMSISVLLLLLRFE